MGRRSRLGVRLLTASPLLLSNLAFPHSVNLGGLFVLEPFIVPSLYQTYVGAVDEWTLSQLISAKDNLTEVLSQHYETFITEDDIAQIAGAGLNFIRLPIPFWAIETWADVGTLATSENGENVNEEVGEPFLARVCWSYILRVLGWARKYGIRVNLDLHTVPGSQNGALVWTFSAGMCG